MRGLNHISGSQRGTVTAGTDPTHPGKLTRAPTQGSAPSMAVDASSDLSPQSSCPHSKSQKLFKAPMTSSAHQVSSCGWPVMLGSRPQAALVLPSSLSRRLRLEPG